MPASPVPASPRKKEYVEDLAQRDLGTLSHSFEVTYVVGHVFVASRPRQTCVICFSFSPTDLRARANRFPSMRADPKLPQLRCAASIRFRNLSD